MKIRPLLTLAILAGCAAHPAPEPPEVVFANCVRSLGETFESVSACRDLAIRTELRRND